MKWSYVCVFVLWKRTERYANAKHRYHDRSVCFICSYSTLSFVWLVFFNYLKILGCVVTLMNDGLYWIVKVARMYTVCSCLGLFPHEASKLSDKADWGFYISWEVRGIFWQPVSLKYPWEKSRFQNRNLLQAWYITLPKGSALLPVILHLYFLCLCAT